MTTLTDELVGVALGGVTVDDAACRIAETAFADTVASLVAGVDERSVALVADVAAEADGPVRSVATGGWTSARSAALVDGTAAHALDYDDVDDSVISHPSAVLVPALLAAGQEHDVTGAQLVRAYLVGLRTCRAVGRALDIGSHFAAGWHSTGTTGTIGAAAAVAALLGLGEQEIRNALGIAGSLTGGSRQNFGTMTKPLHVGTAASQGLTAAYLAARGFTADQAMLDGPLGFLALHRAPGAATAGASAAEGTAGLNVKRFPCCYATHAGIEAALAVRDRLPGECDIVRIEVRVQPGGLHPLIHHRPVDGVQAKFSIEYTVAVALLDGRVGFASFADDRATREDVQALLRTVEPVEADAAGEADGAWYAIVTAHLADGSSTSARVDDPAGHASRPLTPAQLWEKFADCFGGSTPEVEQAYAALDGLRDRASAREVVASVLDARCKSAEVA